MGNIVNLDTVAAAASIASVVMLLRGDPIASIRASGLSLICSSMSTIRRIRRAFDRTE